MAKRLAKTTSSSSSSSSSSLSSNLPPEIIEIILSKLSSIKCVLRFKTVSKSWNIMISDPLFIQTHLRNSSNNLFISKYTNSSTDEGFSLVKLEGRKFHAQAVLKNKNWSYYEILCECNGVLLLGMNLYRSTYMLWNPSTRAEMYFDSYKLNLSLEVNHGIGHDPITDDFKVVVMDESNYGVYSCKNNSWTAKKELGFRSQLRHVGPGGLFVDGATYWVLSSADEKDKYKIVCFDPKTDELTRLQKPEKLLCDDNNSYLCMSLTCLRGKLCLYCDDATKIRIWMKEKDYDWKELITIGNAPALIRFLKPICFLENKILFRSHGFPVIYFCYSLLENTIESFEGSYHDRFVPYRNSLYSFFPQKLLHRLKLSNPV